MGEGQTLCNTKSYKIKNRRNLVKSNCTTKYSKSILHKVCKMYRKWKIQFAIEINSIICLKLIENTVN